MATDPPSSDDGVVDPEEPRSTHRRARRAAGRVADAVEGAVGSVVERVPGVVEDAVESVVDNATDLVGGAVGGAVGAARSVARRWDERPGSRVRRVRRLGRLPLPYLYAAHPEARKASPREIGIRTIGADEIAGTAVGGGAQRGGDFLPLRPFRTKNWHARWARIRRALERLENLPPIDVVRYGGRYWVLDGHNRVAAALYGGQIETDANVVELVPPGEAPSERPSTLAGVLTGSRALRTAGSGRPTVPLTDDWSGHADDGNDADSG